MNDYRDYTQAVGYQSPEHFDRLHAVTWDARCAAKDCRDLENKVDDARDALEAARLGIQAANDNCDFDAIAAFSKAAKKAQTLLDTLAAKQADALTRLSGAIDRLNRWEDECYARPAVDEAPATDHDTHFEQEQAA